MNFINPVKSWNNRDWGKLSIKVRLGKLCVLDLSWDIGSGDYRVEILNIAIANSDNE